MTDDELSSSSSSCCIQPPRKKQRRASDDSDFFVKHFVACLAPGGSAEQTYRKTARSSLWAQNIVTNVRLGSAVDLRNFSASHPNVYVPRRFEACVARLIMMKKLTITGLLFRTLSVVIVGTHSMAHTVKAAHLLRMYLLADGKATTFDSFQLSNMVYNTRVKSKTGINIAAINKKNAERTTYIPLMFPGLQYYAKIPASAAPSCSSANKTTVIPSSYYSVGTGSASEAECYMVPPPPRRRRVRRPKVAKMRIFDTGAGVAMGITNPRDVEQIFAEVEMLAVENPDANLPASDKRFDYRNEQKRKAFSGPSSAWIDVSGSGNEDEDDGDDV